ncbi:MAG: hypothetical protein ACTSYM_03860 [Candidatus Baldrarchaeia archaeon]
MKLRTRPAMTEEHVVNFSEVFKYSGIVLDILIFALIGYVVGQQFGNEVLGTLIGTLIGTFIMWFHLFHTVKKLERKSRSK